MALTENDIEQLYGEIENQGFDYWIQHYGYNEKDLEGRDEKLKDLCEKARTALNDLEGYLRELNIVD